MILVTKDRAVKLLPLSSGKRGGVGRDGHKDGVRLRAAMVNQVADFLLLHSHDSDIGCHEVRSVTGKDRLPRHAVIGLEDGTVVILPGAGNGRTKHLGYTRDAQLIRLPIPRRVRREEKCSLLSFARAGSFVELIFRPLNTQGTRTLRMEEQANASRRFWFPFWFPYWFPFGFHVGFPLISLYTEHPKTWVYGE